MKHKNLAIGVAILIISSLSHVYVVTADNTKCTLSLSPSTISTNTSTNVTFTVNNSSGAEVRWLKLVSATDLYSLTSANASGWSGQTSGMEVVFTGGTLSDGAGGNFNVVIHTTSDQPSESWSAQISGSADGSGALACAGTPTLTVQQDVTQPEISGLVASDITTNSAKISWTTNKATTGKVKYGTTESYGSESSITGNGTSHSVTLNGLSVYTIYHFSVEANDSNGNGANTGDNTFTTAKEESSSSSTPSTVTFSPGTKVTPSPTPIPDTSPPVIKVTTDFSQPFKLAPKIEGTVTDNKAVQGVSFSIDGGKNWLPIEKLTGLGTRFVKFEFVAAAREDGDYPIQIRAVDASKNFGFNKVATLIIDRLPPKVGSIVWSMGPQKVESAPGNILSVLAGVKQKVVLSAVGGATSISLTAQTLDLSDQLSINLTKIVDSGLWSGTISFPQAGVYQLKAKSIDGAKNQTEQNIGTVVVFDNGRAASGGQNLIDVNITVYVYQPLSQNFELWDGASYGQTNPQITTDQGKYNLYLPEGKYYLNLEKTGYKTLNTEIFILDKSTPINADFELSPAIGFKLGPFSLFWPTLFNQTTKLELSEIKIDSSKNSLVGKLLPDFHLTNVGSPTVTNFTFRGKPYLLTFLNSWGAQVPQQLTNLEEVARDQGIGIVVIFPGQTQTTIDIFKKSGGYQLTMVADPDSLLTVPLNLYTLPTHLFISNTGTITDIQTGLLTKDEVITNLID